MHRITAIIFARLFVKSHKSFELIVSAQSNTTYAKKKGGYIFSYIVAVSFIGVGNRSTRRKPPTWRKSLTNFIKLWR